MLTYLQDVVHTLSEDERDTLSLICKWVCDGSQKAQYKETFKNDSDSDAYIFQSSFIPLQLICGTNNKLVWQNPTPSSPRYCRPMRIRFVKESSDITNDEFNNVQSATSSLHDTKVTVADKYFSVKHTLLLTMIEAKVCNAAPHATSTMRCYICGETSKDYNNLSTKNEVTPEKIQFGLSILHVRIRLFEGILHVADKLPVQKLQLRSEDENAIVKQRKLEIQEEFRTKMGLLVDVPKPGCDNTNDGNRSRRFFADLELAGAITGIDVNLIYRFKVILEVISSGHKINTGKYSKYATDTAEIMSDYIRGIQ